MQRPEDVFGKFIIDGTKFRFTSNKFVKKAEAPRFSFIEEDDEKDSVKIRKDEDFFINAIINFFQTDERSKSITELNLEDNNLTEASISKLAKYLETNTTIKKLKLCNNQCNGQRMISLAEMLEKNVTLEVLDITTKDESSSLRYQGGIFGNGDIKALAKALKKNSSLQTLKLRGISIADEGFKSLAKSIHNKNFTLRQLQINRPQLSIMKEPEANYLNKMLEDSLERNKNIFIQMQGTLQALRKFGHFPFPGTLQIPGTPQNRSTTPPPQPSTKKRHIESDAPRFSPT